jgi:DNA-binding phage protein
MSTIKRIIHEEETIMQETDARAELAQQLENEDYVQALVTRGRGDGVSLRKLAEIAEQLGIPAVEMYLDQREAV